jgi:hypothetical protein
MSAKECYTCGDSGMPMIKCESDRGDEWYFCGQDCFWAGHKQLGWGRFEAT